MSVGNTLQGLGACVVSTILFGSMFVPIKQQDPGDGFFVQFIVDTAIFIIGMIINAYKGFPKFYPLAMLGGVLWGAGNATAIPILQSIGLGMGVLIWGITNCLMGWASSRFGLFGLKKNVPNNVPLNYVGLLFILAGGVLFALVKPTPKTKENDATPSQPKDAESSPTTPKPGDGSAEQASLLKNAAEQENNASSMKKRIFGVSLALIAGLFYGSTFVPVIYVQEHPDKFPGASPEALSYVFAHYTGIFVTGTIILIVYSTVKCNRPVVNNRIILPAYITGTMWAIAQTSWFVANDYIAQSISFPINSMVPGVIAALWSVLCFREVRGSQNLKILSAAVLITIVGAIMVGLSKDL